MNVGGNTILEDDDDDVLIAKAIEESLATRQPSSSSTNHFGHVSTTEEEESFVARAMQPSLATQRPPAPTMGWSDSGSMPSEDVSVARAIETSLTEHKKRKTEETERNLWNDRELAKAMSQSYREHRISEEQRKSTESVELALAIEQSDYDTIVEEQRNVSLQHAINYTLRRTEERNMGSWDCLHCTLVNKPYRQKCRACGAAAPPHVLTFQPLPPIPFGLEIEMILPQGKLDGMNLKSIAKNLTKASGENVRFLGYSHETTPYWKIVTDSSIQSDHPGGYDDDLCFELVSPVLQDEVGLCSLRRMMEHVRSLGIATNASCGFHVHIDASKGSQIGSLNGLKRVAQCFVSLENAFDLLVSQTWNEVIRNDSTGRRGNSNRYCRSNRLVFGQKSNRQRWEEIQHVSNFTQLVNLINPARGRYFKLNLTNITKRDRPSTCEFRHHGGVEDLKEAEAWVRLVLLFTKNAASCSQESFSCLLPEDSSHRQEVNALFNIVGCQGLQQFFVVDRKLFLTDRLQNRWKCPVCFKQFENSRSLAQHCFACGHN